MSVIFTGKVYTSPNTLEVVKKQKNLKTLIIDNLFTYDLIVMKLCTYTVVELGNT